MAKQTEGLRSGWGKIQPRVLREADVLAQADRAARITGHRTEDWAILASVRETTAQWSPAVGELLKRCLKASGDLSEDSSAIEDRALGAASWFESIAAGKGGAGLWIETAFFGLSLATLEVSNITILSFVNRLDALLTLNCAKAFPIDQGIEVGRAFTRILGVAQAVMSSSHERAFNSGVSQLGMSPTLMTRLRSETLPKMIGDAWGSMSLITWDDSLVMGIDELDVRHQELLERLDEVHRVQPEVKGRSEALAAVDRLSNCTTETLAFEEAVYERHAVPELEAHRAVHHGLVTKIMIFADDWKSGGPDSKLGDFTGFFRHWLSEHLRSADRAAGAYLRSLGLR